MYLSVFFFIVFLNFEINHYCVTCIHLFLNTGHGLGIHYNFSTSRFPMWLKVEEGGSGVT